VPAISSYYLLDGKYTPVRVRHLLSELDDIEQSGLITGVERSRFLNKANSFTTSAGFDPGRAYLLLRGSDVKDLTKSNLNTTSHSLKFITGGSTIEIKDLLIVQCEAITGGKGNSDQAIYLCELADKRILGPLTSVNRAYNVYTIDNALYEYSTNGGAAWDYQSLVLDLWAAMPSAFGSLDTSNANFNGTPANYCFHGISAWDALKKVLDDINHILTLYHGDGKFYLYAGFEGTSDLTDDMENAKNFLQVNSLDKISACHKTPANVVVHFPKRNRAWQLSNDQGVISGNDAFREDPLFTVSVASQDNGAISGTKLAVHDPMLAIYNELGELQNEPALNDRANQVASQYLGAIDKADNTFHYRYTGAQEFSPGVEVDSVSWHDFGDGVQTTVRGNYRPRGSSPLLDMHRDGGLASANDSAPGHLILSSKELTGPPALTRYGEQAERIAVIKLLEPLYPALWDGAGTTIAFKAAAEILWGKGLGADLMEFNSAEAQREIEVWQAVHKNYDFPVTLLAWFNTQCQRWVIFDSPIGIPFVNDGESEFPIDSVMQWEDVVEVDGVPYLSCVEVGEDFLPSFVVNTSGRPIPPGEFGLCSFADGDQQVRVRVNASSLDLPTYGPKHGSLELEEGYLGWEAIGDLQPTDDGGMSGLFRQKYVDELFGKIYNQDLSQGGTTELQIMAVMEGELQNLAWNPIQFTDIWLNNGEKIKIGTKAVIKLYGSIWCLWQSACDPDNTVNQGQ